MKTRPGRALVAWIAILSFSPIHAAGLGAALHSPAERADDERPLAWLKSKNYSALEQYYGQRQKDYEAGKTSDETLYGSFRKLYEDSLDNQGYFDQWVEAFPRSYAALLARGAYQYRMALSIRGDKYVNETPPEQFDAMDNWLARARPDLIASLKLTAKPYLSTLYLLNVAIREGTAAESRQWFEAGMAMDPANTLLRYRYMFSLRPRWGGSYEQMREFLRRCEDQHVPPVLLARMSMLIHADLAEDAMRASDERESFSEWGQVLKLAETAGEAPEMEALIGYTRAAQDLNKPADAERGIQQLLERKPDDVWSIAQVGWIYATAHRDSDAWPLLLQAAELDDPWAQYVVGHDTYRGNPTLHKPADQAGGLAWIQQSAQHCYPPALQFLRKHGQTRPLGCGRSELVWWLKSRRGWSALVLLMALIGLVVLRRTSVRRRRQTE